MGRLNKLGKPFRKTSIRDILLNEKYTGVFVYGKKDGHGKLTGNEVKIEGGIPQIITKEDFEKIQIKMKNRKKISVFSVISMTILIMLTIFFIFPFYLLCILTFRPLNRIIYMYVAIKLNKEED